MTDTHCEYFSGLVDDRAPLIAPLLNEAIATNAYAHALERLVIAVQELSLARSLEQIMGIVKEAARAITGADGATFILRDRDCCYYADESAIAPLWKGKRFPLDSCLGGWSMNHREAVTIENVFGDERVPYAAYQPTFVKSLVMVPIRMLNPIGAIGSYWAQRHQPTDREVKLLQALADTTAVAMENVQVHDELEQRVTDRTAQLAASNQALCQEIIERQAIEAQLRALSLTDNLTGLNNHRGFFVLSEQVWKTARRSQHRCLLMFVDCDGLKKVNDSLGHEVGSAMLVDAARVLVSAFRGTDIVGRLGGDEFAVFSPECNESMAGMRDRLLQAVQQFNAQHDRPYHLSMSVGVVECLPGDDRSVEELIIVADERMYIHKRERRVQREMAVASSRGA
ncbi:MAG TPA: diguanylate cyclase [Coleofasciculaceae cyanobacterium]